MKQTAIRFFILQAGLLFAAALLSIFLVQPNAEAARIKDIANVRGVRDNQLIG